MKFPEKESTWRVVGQGYILKIEDWWSTGLGDRYRRVMYELSYSHTRRHQYIAADRLHELIEEKKIEQITIKNI